MLRESEKQKDWTPRFYFFCVCKFHLCENAARKRTCHSRRQAVKQASLIFGLEDVRGRWRTFLLADEVVEQRLHQPAG